ncbi:trypsin-like serine peptidase [Roseisalinus antarcticus]|nr:trypsin-like serine protease [Roseisalinus antarcticus]
MIASLLCIATGATGAAAEDTGLESLVTRDAVRGWEAVGRLDIDGKGFCTASLIDEQTVMTAAHCLFDSETGDRVDPARMQFLAGLRDGQAMAYRGIRQAVAHPDYVLGDTADIGNIASDVALLELDQPIRSTQIIPFEMGAEPQAGEAVGIVSYAQERAEVPSLQEVCTILGFQSEVLVMSCDVNYGSSGAPIFSLAGGQARIVSLVAAKAEIDTGRVALGMPIAAPNARIRGIMEDGGGRFSGIARTSIRVLRPGEGDTRETGAKFLRP